MAETGYDELMATMMEKRSQKTMPTRKFDPVPMKTGMKPEAAYRVMTEGAKLEIEEIFKDPQGRLGISCCFEGCCVSWCCIQIS
ncbi:MAG TPA: hypothetical protein HA262_04890 [Methanosarcina sp.]|mgnify:CR=1 FL=1|jgi:hypothetical protein|nr:hypothetical protein [Methanosarcina sp.]